MTEMLRESKIIALCFVMLRTCVLQGIASIHCSAYKLIASFVRNLIALCLLVLKPGGSIKRLKRDWTRHCDTSDPVTSR